MRLPFPDAVEKGRVEGNPKWETSRGDPYGLFVLKAPTGAYLQVIACDAGCGESGGTGWDHVSAGVLGPDRRLCRCPTWEEMCWLKGLFWHDDECVVQFHPPADEYVNTHPFVLHLWRDAKNGHPTPPTLLV